MSYEDIKKEEVEMRERLEKNGNKVWNTTELQEDFEVLGFCAGFCAVKRKSDGVVGSLDFSHRPRLYYGFVED